MATQSQTRWMIRMGIWTVFPQRPCLYTRNVMEVVERKENAWEKKRLKSCTMKHLPGQAADHELRCPRFQAASTVSCLHTPGRVLCKVCMIVWLLVLENHSHRQGEREFGLLMPILSNFTSQIIFSILNVSVADCTSVYLQWCLFCQKTSQSRVTWLSQCSRIGETLGLIVEIAMCLSHLSSSHTETRGTL